MRQYYTVIIWILTLQINPHLAWMPTLQKKRSTQEFIRAQQLTHKFKAKSDFIHYFSEARKRILILINLPSVQLYLPPKTMFNKDFLK